MMERITNIGAIGAASNYFWIWALEDISTALSIFLSIMGILWLAMQMYYKIKGK